MGRIIMLYLTCEEINVRARVGYQSDFSTLEELVDRTIQNGVQDFDKLCALFGISKRLMLDVIADLLSSGRIAVDSARNRVYRTKRDDSAQRTSRGLVGAMEHRSVMYDLITGHILPVAGDKQQPRSPFVIPFQRNRIQAIDLNPLRLRWALEKAINDERKDGPPRKVIEAGLTFDSGGERPPHRWMPLQAEALINESGYVRVNLLGNSRIPASIRRQIESSIHRYLLDHPNDPFSIRLQDCAGDSKTAPPRLNVTEAVRNLADAVADIKPDDVDKMAKDHENAQKRAAAAAAAIEDARARSARVRILLGIEENRKRISGLIRKAKWQLVLATPHVRYDRDPDSLLSDLEYAVKKGVTVFLLWGAKGTRASGKSAGLDEYFVNAIMRINQGTRADGEERPRGLIRTSLTPAGTRAKFIVQDDEAAIITSLNFLDFRDGDAGEIGVQISRSRKGPTCEAVVDLLRWARENFPDYDVAQTIGTVMPSWMRGAIARRAEGTSLESEPLPHHPGPPPRAITAPASDIAMGAWALGWKAYSQEIERLSEIGPTVLLLRDGEHRAAFDHALAEAKHRLIVSSDQISPDALTPDRIDRLITLAHKGVEVRLLYREALRQDPSLSDAIVNKLRSEARSIPSEKLKVIKARNCAQMLVFDDTAVISSFNFLLQAGNFRNRIGTKRESSEIGAIISSRQIVDKILQSIEATDDSGHIIKVTSSPTSPGETRLRLERHKLGDTAARLAKHGAVSDEAALREALRDTNNPWEDLDQFERIGVPEMALLAAAEVALAERGKSESTPAGSRWVARLAAHAWEAGDPIATLTFAVTAMKSSEATQIAGVPSLPVLALSAAGADRRLADEVYSAIVAYEMSASKEETGLFGILFAEDPRWTGDTAMEERFAVLAAALTDFILFSSEPASELLELFGDSMPTSWSGLSRRAIAARGDGAIPFPFEDVTHTYPREHSEADLEKLWKVLSDEVRDAESKHTQYGPANDAWRYLYQTDQALGKLKLITTQRDPQSLASWCDVYLGNAEKFLDEAAGSVTGWRKVAIIGKKVRTYMRTLAKIEEISSEIISASGSPTPYKADEFKAAEAFANEISDVFDELRAEAEPSLKTPCARLVTRAIDQLRRVSMKGVE